MQLPTMADERKQINQELMILLRESFLRRQSGSMFDNTSASFPFSNEHKMMTDANPEPMFGSEIVVPEKVASFINMPRTKAMPSTKDQPVDLTLEEIFRDHDLQESTNTLENTMGNLGEDSTSDLSGIFDDDEQEAPLAHSRDASSSNFYSSASSVDTVDTNETADDGAQRFKPFHEEKWNTRFRELMNYRQEHGDCLVPHTFNPNPQLARWVKRQRRQYKLMLEGRSSTMSQDRLDILNEINFVWDSHDAAWQEKLNELSQYCKENGNCLVPSNYKINPQLATWVKCQRRQYKLYWIGRPSAMTPERIIRLEQLGFEWEIRASNQAGVARSDYLYLSEAISKLA
jgi:Helicase associated domain